MSLLLIAIFKNESNIIEEWIEHYINEGVDCFLLNDNGSTDNYEHKIQKYIDAGFVVLNKNPKKYAQVEIYNDCIDCARKFDWVMVVDLDEFVYARNGFNTIKEYLNSLESNVSQIHIPWKIFGSSDFMQQPKSVIQNFTWRQIYNTPTKIECKCIIRGNNLKTLHIHHSISNNKNGNKDIFSNNRLFITKDINFIENLNENFLSNSFLQLNHYKIQSWEFFSKIKRTRGDVTQSCWDNLRDKKYFDSSNYKHIEDNELKNKEYNNQFSFDNDSFTGKENQLIKNVEIVVSRYNENLEWLNYYPFNQFQYTVYNKGINENFNKKNVTKIITLPNVGVCDHTYLYHIVSNYDENTLKPITIFLPGSVNMPNKINKAISILTKVLLKQSAFLIGEYTENVFHFFKNFMIEHYITGNSENFNLNNGSELIKSNIRPFGNWYRYNFGAINVRYYTMNGIFSLNKKDIMKYKKFRYEKILNQLSIASNLEMAHYMERSWSTICYPLLHTKVSLTYPQKNISQPLKTNSIRMNMGGIRPLRVRPVVRRIQVRNLRNQNYLRGRLLRRRNFMRRATFVAKPLLRG